MKDERNRTWEMILSLLSALMVLGVVMWSELQPWERDLLRARFMPRRVAPSVNYAAERLIRDFRRDMSRWEHGESS
jgi:hypothetical protein